MSNRQKAAWNYIRDRQNRAARANKEIAERDRAVDFEHSIGVRELSHAEWVAVKRLSENVDGTPGTHLELLP